MTSIVLHALLPVVALILAGVGVGRSGWLSPRVVKRLSALAFNVLTPALLFRAMSKVHVEQLDLLPAWIYMLVLTLVVAGFLWVRGLTRDGGVLALAATYSNGVMIGIPLVTLAWGDAGLVTLLTLVPVHSLYLLAGSTVLLEVIVARESGAGPLAGAAWWRALRVGGRALRKALVHPVPLPIIAGLVFAQTGWVLPVPLETLLRWMGMAFSPIALVLVGISLARSSLGAQLRPALLLTGIKSLLIPLVTAALAWLLGLRGLPFAVTVVLAALPMGANGYLFAQRYETQQERVAAGVALSTFLSVLTVPLFMLLLGPL